MPAAPSNPAKSATAASQSKLFVQSIDKAMKVLTAFDGSRRQLSLSEIARLTGVGISAAQRFTYTLSALGYLRKDANSQYELSPRLLNFGNHYISSNELVSRAAPLLQQLALSVEEATNLTVLDGDEIVFVSRFISRHSLFPAVHVGSRLPAFCTAPGLAMLATLDAASAQQLLEQSDLRQHSVHTITDIGQITQRLQQIRSCGYALTREEYFLGDISTAAAITDTHGRAIGAINVAIARSRWQDERDQTRIAEQVMDVARALSQPRKR